jgi:hypothetical protein
MERTMTTSTCPSTIRLVRPLHERLLEALNGAWQGVRQAVQRRAEQRRLARELDAVADMNELLLRDIGAPEWLVAQAQARRDSDRQRLVELNLGLPRHE